MTLEVQIQSLITSLVFGMYLSLIYNLFYKSLHKKNIIKRTFNCLSYSIINSIIYFYLMYLINYGAIHIYFIFILIIGSVISNNKTKKIRRE